MEPSPPTACHEGRTLKSSAADPNSGSVGPAVETPLQVMRHCNDTIEAAATVARFETPMPPATSASRWSSWPPPDGARLNVEINLVSLDDQADVSRVRERVSVLDAEATTGAAAARVAPSQPPEVFGSPTQCQLSTETVNGIGRL